MAYFSPPLNNSKYYKADLVKKLGGWGGGAADTDTHQQSRLFSKSLKP